MAEKGKKPAAAPEVTPEAAPAAAPKKSFSAKALVVLVAVFVIEGAAISAAFLIAGKPADVKGSIEAAQKANEAEKQVEVLVLADKFQNTKTGRTYIYDTEIYAVVRKKKEESVKNDLKSMSAQLTADVGVIFRRAEPSHLLEPTLATLTRQIKGSLEERLGKDADGKPVVDEVLIKKYTQYRSDI